MQSKWDLKLFKNLEIMPRYIQVFYHISRKIEN